MSASDPKRTLKLNVHSNADILNCAKVTTFGLAGAALSNQPILVNKNIPHHPNDAADVGDGR
jgi:hypothetical protein